MTGPFAVWFDRIKARCRHTPKPRPDRCAVLRAFLHSSPNSGQARAVRLKPTPPVNEILHGLYTSYIIGIVGIFRGNVRHGSHAYQNHNIKFFIHPCLFSFPIASSGNPACPGSSLLRIPFSSFRPLHLSLSQSPVSFYVPALP